MPKHTTQSTIYNYFGVYGNISSIYIQRNKRYAFINFYDHKSVIKALKEMNNTKVNNCIIKCEFSKHINVTKHYRENEHFDNNSKQMKYASHTNRNKNIINEQSKHRSHFSRNSKPKSTCNKHRTSIVSETLTNINHNRNSVSEQTPSAPQFYSNRDSNIVHQMHQIYPTSNVNQMQQIYPTTNVNQMHQNYPTSNVNQMHQSHPTANVN